MMKGFLKIVGFFEILGGATLFVIFLFRLRDLFDWYMFLGSIILFINGAFYFYLSDLGYKVEDLEKRLNKLEGIKEKTVEKETKVVEEESNKI